VITNIFGLKNLKSTSDIKVLRIHDQIVMNMPSSLEIFFPHLIKLQIWSSRLQKLTQNDLKFHRNLKELSVSSNELEVLPSNLFEFNVNLEKIDFSRNHLKSVGFNLMTPLTNLIYADFYQNYCISDGSRNSIELLVKNLRENCKPTVDSLINDVMRLNDEIKLMKIDLTSCVNINRKCGESPQLISLDSLFPSLYTEENKIDDDDKSDGNYSGREIFW
jgi:hypothetical protein